MPMIALQERIDAELMSNPVLEVQTPESDEASQAQPERDSDRGEAPMVVSDDNINTPVEFYNDRIRYVDLEIDVVRLPGGKAEIIDEDVLERRFLEGSVTETLKDAALKAAAEMKSRLLSGDFVPPHPPRREQPWGGFPHPPRTEKKRGTPEA